MIERWLFNESRYCSQDVGTGGETGVSEGASAASVGGGPVASAGATAIISPSEIATGTPATFAAQQQQDIAAFVAQQQQADIAAFLSQGQGGLSLIAASDIGPLAPAPQLPAPQLPGPPIRSPEDSFREQIERFSPGPLRQFIRQPLSVLNPERFIEKVVTGSIQDFVSNFSRPMRAQRPSARESQRVEPFTRQPSTEPAPLIIPSKQGCTTCGQDLQRLQRQRDEVQREIKQEETQQREQRIEQQQREIEQHEQEEQRPLGQRDIQQELQQKRALQSQIEQEIRDLQAGTDQSSFQGQQTGETAPLVQQPLFTQREPVTVPQQQVQNPVRFCVACTSQAESLKFLNGEPSECSVEA